jgi:hypothetical protein
MNSFVGFIWIIWPWGQRCMCVTIRWCVTYRNDLCGTLTFEPQGQIIVF